MTLDLATVWVCTDCYFAHHYGYSTVERPLTEGEAVRYLSGYDHGVSGDIIETVEGVAARQFFAGDSDTPSDREPLNLLDGLLYDNTCSNHYYGQDPQPTDEHDVYDEPCNQCGHNGDENGITEHSQSQCDGCGSILGGPRYRLACEITEV